MASLPLDLRDGLLEVLTAWGRARGLSPKAAAERLISTALLRDFMTDTRAEDAFWEAGPAPEDNRAVLAESLAIGYAVASRDAMAAAAGSPAAAAIGWEGLARATCAWRGIPTPLPDPGEVDAFVALGAGVALEPAQGDALAGWLERRGQELVLAAN
jgi:hypothetical protein